MARRAGIGAFLALGAFLTGSVADALMLALFGFAIGASRTRLVARWRRRRALAKANLLIDRFERGEEARVRVAVPVPVDGASATAPASRDDDEVDADRALADEPAADEARSALRHR